MAPAGGRALGAGNGQGRFGESKVGAECTGARAEGAVGPDYGSATGLRKPGRAAESLGGDGANGVLHRHKDLSGLLFPSPVRQGKPMSDMTLTKLLRDFRSTFRDWAGTCTDAPEPVMELSLAHTVGNAVMRAYARSGLPEKRRRLMDEWAAHVATVPRTRAGPARE